MTDKNTREAKMSSGCSEKMQEMVKKMMSGKSSTCCPCAEIMTEMMPGCCSILTEKEKSAAKGDQEAPR